MLKNLVVFAKVVETGSITGAAKQFGISTSAVSQRVKALEKELGEQLCFRTTRSIRLSEAGENLYKASLEVIDLTDKAVDLLFQRHTHQSLNKKTTIKIGCHESLVEPIIAPLVCNWDKSDGVDIQFVTDIKNEHNHSAAQHLDFKLDIVEIAKETDIVLGETCEIFVASKDYIDELAHSSKATFTLLTLAAEKKGRCTSPERILINNEQVLCDRTVTADEEEGLVKLALSGCGILKTSKIAVVKYLANGSMISVGQDKPLKKLYVVLQPLQDAHGDRVESCVSHIKQSAKINLTKQIVRNYVY